MLLSSQNISFRTISRQRVRSSRIILLREKAIKITQSNAQETFVATTFHMHALLLNRLFDQPNQTYVRSFLQSSNFASTINDSESTLPWWFTEVD
jgi:hypothetical protein